MAKKDVNQLAHLIVAIATGEVAKPDPTKGKKPSLIERGRKGGLKGGKARAAKLTPRERKEIARKAAQKRWGK